jgi:hypothetical protein
MEIQERFKIPCQKILGTGKKFPFFDRTSLSTNVVEKGLRDRFNL